MSVPSEALIKPGTSYSAETMREAAGYYVVTGSITKTSELTGIPKSTIGTWKANNAKWLELVEQVRNEKQEEIDAGYTRIIHKGIQVVEDRLENGEVTFDKDGNEIKTPVKMRDAAWTMAVTFDKRQILRNMPTSISNNSNLDVLAKKLEQLDKQLNAKVINHEE